VPDAKPWSPESPHLYDLRLELLDAKEGVIDRVGSYAGRRRVHLENGRFRLNNRPIFLRHRNHPPIIAWTPWNEVWATDHDDQVARTLRDTSGLTRALDPTRPVHTASGGAHVATDIWSVHCYEQTGPGLAAVLAAVLAAGEDATLAKVQRAHAEALTKAGLPLFVGEFGGIKWNTPGSGAPPENWGYGDAPKDKEAFLQRLYDLVNTVLALPGCAGYCYTQLTDVEQEVNGIYTYDRREKFDMSHGHLSSRRTSSRPRFRRPRATRSTSSFPTKRWRGRSLSEQVLSPPLRVFSSHQQQPPPSTPHLSGARQAVCFVPR
jgi:hypothetical protein